ncbi:MAG: S8 family serine peptidase [Phycisphaerales bacterium]|nr:S8 family serine peptidase [Phycisphaerales bacterium]
MLWNRIYRISSRISVAGIVLASGNAIGADLSQNNQPNAEQRSVMSIRGAELFLVDDLSASTSTASRINTDLADKQGSIPDPTPGYILTGRIVVQTSDLAMLNNRVQQLNTNTTRSVAVAAHSQVNGFAIVDAGSVGAAIELAQSLRATGAFESVELDMTRPYSLRAPSDPSFSSQWHLRNTLVVLADINADAAWDLGYTGSGVTVGIVEGKFQQNHPDLAPNFFATATMSGGSLSSHATSSAGIAAASGNNGQGGVGLAYDSLLSNQIIGSSSQTASAFEFRNDLNDVKSNSWGPFDNGEITYLSSIERAAIENTAINGRAGLGTILCWAAGNGGTGDRVEYDPYASSRHTLAIGAVGDLDTRAWYNETGSSMLVVAHSSGNNRGTWTTTTASTYTSNFGGTSSSSPLAMGAVALILEANPALTQRDVQHVLVNSARVCDPFDKQWGINGAGHMVSLNYGFGAIDVGASVLLAESWTNVGPEVQASSGVVNVNLTIPDNNTNGITRVINISEDIVIEAVELILNIDTTYVGDLQILLTSPDGTQSLLATARGDSQDDYVDYIFTSVRHWDEMSAGDWTINISDRGPGDVPFWDDLEIIVYGTDATTGACSDADLAEPLGELNLQDVFAYLALFNSADPSADLAKPIGVLNLQDVFAYLGEFNNGCP